MYSILDYTVIGLILLSKHIHSDIIGHVLTLDYVVCNLLLQPQTGQEEKLSSELLQLYIALDDIHDMLRDEREAGKAIVQKVLEGGGLRLPSIKPNYSLIMTAFNWTTDESKALGALFKDTVGMWRNIQIGMDIVPTTEIDYNLNPEKDKK
uniref:Uncharacterized protein n=1 Tax=Homalodisca liturata TaxID=320908 RepID=A0A1B6IX84_9HEMI